MGIFDFFQKKIKNYEMGYLLYQIFNLEINNREIDFKNIEISYLLTNDEFIQIGRKLCKAVEVLNFDMKFQSTSVNEFCESHGFKLLLNNQKMTKEDVLKIINNCKSLSISEFLDFTKYLNTCIKMLRNSSLEETSKELGIDFKNKSEQITNTSAFIYSYMSNFSIIGWMTCADAFLKIGVNPDEKLTSRPGALSSK